MAHHELLLELTQPEVVAHEEIVVISALVLGKNHGVRCASGIQGSIAPYIHSVHKARDDEVLPEILPEDSEVFLEILPEDHLAKDYVDEGYDWYCYRSCHGCQNRSQNRSSLGAGSAHCP